jgi:hypothetical protein
MFKSFLYSGLAALLFLAAPNAYAIETVTVIASRLDAYGGTIGWDRYYVYQSNPLNSAIGQVERRTTAQVLAAFFVAGIDISKGVNALALLRI